MTLPAHDVRSSYADYLSIEAMSPDVRHEFIDGQIFAMAGGSPEHARLIGNTIVALGIALRGKPCQVYPSELKIRIDACNVTTYPDVSVACGGAEVSPLDPHAIVNPVLIVEVTSPSTERYDRGKKLEYYQAVPSVQEILVVSHRVRRFTLSYRKRDASGLWTPFSTVDHEDERGSLHLESASVRLNLSDVYGELPLRST